MLFFNERAKLCMPWAVISVKLFLSFCNFIGAHFCNNKNQAILQQKKQNHISHMGIRTSWYTAMEEQNYVGKIGIRTPCYLTIKEQNYVGKMDISTPWYISMKVQNYVGKMDMRTTMLYYNTCLFIYVLLLEI